MIELKATPASTITLPSSSQIKKIFLDSDGVLKVIGFSGEIKSLGGPVITNKVAINQLNAVINPIIEFLLGLINVNEEITSEQLQVVNDIIKKIIEDTNALNTKVDDNASLVASQIDSQLLANGIVDSNISEIEQRVSELIDELKLARSNIGSLAELTQTNSDDTLKLNKDLVEFVQTVLKKISLIKIPIVPTIVSDSSNVVVTYREGEVGIAVDIPKVVEQVVQSGGTSKNRIIELINEYSPPQEAYTPLITTASISGSLDTRLTAIETIEAAEGLVKFTFLAPEMDNPVTSDWVVNALAPNTTHPSNSGIIVRAFDATSQEGVGITFELPPLSNNLTFTFTSCGATSVGGMVVPKLYTRYLRNNAAISSWSAGVTGGTLTLPASTSFRSDVFNFTSSTLGVSGGDTVFLELTRDAVNTNDTLSVDWLLLKFKLEVT